MKQVEVVGKSSYWNVEKSEWTSVDVKTTANVPESGEEAIGAIGTMETLVQVVADYLVAQARESAAAIPSGTWSRAMASAATRAFKAMPQFSALKSSALRDAVMVWLGKTNQLSVLYPAFSALAAAADSDEE